MNNIVQVAKRLVEQGFTPPPWGVVRHDFGYDSHFVAGPVELPIKPGEPNIVRECHAVLIAAAPDLAQALAEETWEYQVQARSMKSPAWEPSTNGVLQKWYGAEDIEEAKGKARAFTPYFHGREEVEIRVLRRRVSPPEVINE